jgi:uncharacterized membrane protein
VRVEMESVRGSRAASVPEQSERVRSQSGSQAWSGPVVIFIVLSALFGTMALIVNPPLRGPDETAHFLRVFGITEGDFVPSVRDDQGRKGIFVPAPLYDDLSFFERARYQLWSQGSRYHAVADEYMRINVTRVPDDERQGDFMLYQGSEAYSPAPYVAYIVAAGVGRAAGLDFLGLFYLMRVVGFVAMTGVAAYAIAIVPHLKWTFLLIAMVPSALYGRTVIGADGAALSFTLVVTALCLRSAAGPGREGIWERAAFLTICVLSKPPQIAWLALEFMVRPWRQLPNQWRVVALVALPGLALTALWVVVVSADVGAWRVAQGTSTPAQSFEPARKLALLFGDPLRFPKGMIASLGTWEVHNLWRQLIGVLGWLDTGLREWVYPVVSAGLVASFFTPLPLERALRYRIAAASGLGVAGYTILVYLVFYLTWTPVDAQEIWGVQGRYFVVVLAPLALCVSALVNRGPSPGMRSALAVGCATLSGTAIIEALVRVNW